jgi:EmrB/QacA subfamily drug resistance transporter
VIVGNQGSSNRWKVLATVCCGLFMIMLQGNVINIAIPRIQALYGVDLAAAQWVTNGYLLVFTMLLVTLGRLGDAVGRKRLFCAGLVFYALGALWNGFSSGWGLGIWSLIAGACFQGIGGAAMMPATQALIADNFEAEERATALGIWGAVTGIAAAVGPTLGGVLTEYGLGAGLNAFLGVAEGWRYIYFISAFLGLGILAAALRIIPESKDPEAKGEYDIVAILLSAAAVFLLVFGLIKGKLYGWWERKADFEIFGKTLGLGSLSVTPLFFALSLAFFLLLGLWEAKRRKEKLVDFSLFRIRDFAAGSASAAILSFAMMGITFLVPVFLQSVLHFSAIRAGLVMLPMALAVAVASPLAGQVSNRIGPRLCVMSGMAILGLGSLLIAHFSPTSTFGSLVLPFIVIGIGIGLATGPITNAALRKVEGAKVGGASGLLSMLRQLGSVLGIAIFTSAFAGSVGDFSAKRIGAIDTSVLPATVSSKIVEGLRTGSGSMSMGGTEGSAMADKMLAFFPKARAEKIKAAIGNAMLEGLSDSVNATLMYAAMASALGILVAAGMSGKKRGGEGGKRGGASGPEAKARRTAGARKATAIALVAASAAAGLSSCAAAPRAAPAPVQSQQTLAPLAWTDEAAAIFAKEVPLAVQKIARKKMEADARSQGLPTIDLAFYEAEKKSMNK